MNQTINLIDEIKDLYSKVSKKTKFIILASVELEKSALTLRHHWFGQFWSIPEEHQSKVKELLELTIENQEHEKQN